MDYILKVVIVLAIALLLISANLWFVSHVYETFFGGALPSVIEPFTVISKEGKDEPQKGLALAQMLAAELQVLRHEINGFSRALAYSKTRKPQVLSSPKLSKEAGADAPDDSPPATTLALYPVSLRTKVNNPLDIDIQVGGAKLGGIIARLQRYFAADRSISASIIQTDTGFTIALGVTGDNSYTSFDLSSAKAATLTMVVQEMAFRLTQRQFTRQIKSIATLSSDDFHKLLTTFSRLGTLNNKLEHGEVVVQGFANILPDLEYFITKLPNWRDLLDLGLQAAINAKDYRRTFDFAKTKLALIDVSSPEYKEVLEAIEKYRSAVISGVQIYGIFRTIKKLVGAEENLQGDPPRIAILGAGLPQRGIVDDDLMTVVSDPQSVEQTSADPVMTGLVSAVRIVEPNSKFIFLPSIKFDANMIRTTVGEIARETLKGMTEKPDVILITYGPLNSQAATFIRLLVSEGIVVLCASGRGMPLHYLEKSPLLQEILFISATDLKGNFTSFNLHTDHRVIYAPGIDIPVEQVPQGWTTMSNNSAAAAIAAAVIGKIRAQYRSVPLSSFLAAVRDSATSVNGREVPRILNRSAALQKLAQILVKTGEHKDVQKLSDIKTGK